jgi:imidazolonepropionase-like amidohydrolase
MRFPAVLLLVASTAWAQVTAIVGATVVDGTGASPRRATVVIQGDRIASVGGEVPEGAKVIRAEGHTVTPGFFDLHTHLPYSGVEGIWGDWAKTLKAYLYCGVTSVVDFGSYPEMFEPMRRLLREKTVIGPRIRMAARITTPDGHGAEGGRGDLFSLEVLTPADARAAMKRWLAYQPDAIKVFTDGWRYGSGPDMTSMDEATLAAIVTEAHKAGVEVLTHTVTARKALEAARAGVDVIAHGIGDATAGEELVRILAAKGTTYAPTLAVYETKRGPYHPMQRLLLEPAALALLPAQRKARETAARKKRWTHLMANVAKLRAGGVRIATGTDAGVTGTTHGWSTLHEMELLVAGGMTPLEAITSATGTAARGIRVDGERGTIAEGKLADLVIVEGLPHQNIGAIDQIRRVFLGGVEIDRKALLREIAREGPTPLPAQKAAALIDDMEGERTSVDTLRVNATDQGNDHSAMMFQRILRGPGNHALAVQARMSNKKRPYAQVWLPLAKGGVEPVDASSFQGIEFEARGEGGYRVLFHQRSVRSGKFRGAPFQASGEWTRMRLPLPEVRNDLQVIAFEIALGAGRTGWLELDNVRFY